ncbi:MAG: hypothetical protein L0Z50_31075 [Verrucomicrobiales bacterium]|nr:hypothetical protein [Verrucomicrobiales bacterium]
MKIIFYGRRIATFIILAAGLLLIKGAEMRFPLPPETTKLKPGLGSALVTAQCLLCHSADYITTQPKLSRTAWKATVLKMQQRYGGPLQTNTVDTLVDYLVKNYGNEVAELSAPRGK